MPLVLPSAITLAIILFCGKFLPSTGEALEQQTYLAVGALSPFLVISTSLFVYRPRTLRWLKLLGGLSAIALLFYLRSRIALWMGLATALSAITILGPRWKTGLLPGLLAWLASLRLIGFWLPELEETLTTQWGSLLLWAFILGTHLAFAPRTKPAHLSWRTAKWTLALILFFLASFRQIYELPGCFVHGGFYFGTVSLLEKGGYLLWDIPSQYGFIHLLVTSLLPLSGAVQKVYVASSVCLFVTSLILLWVWLEVFPSILGGLGALILVFTSTFLVPGWVASLAGPNVFPSVGGFRFLCVYLILGWVAWVDRNSALQNRPIKVWHLWIGSLLWTLGTLWSAEVAIFSSCGWFPAFYFWNRSIGNRNTGWRFLIPLGALAGLWIPICGFYLLRLGHLPDFYCFIEYAKTYAAGFGTLPITHDGAISAIIWFWGCLLASFAYGLRKERTLLPSITAALGTFWSVSVYFVGRSAENSILNLMPIYLLAIGVTLASLSRLSDSRGLFRILLVAFSPAIALIFLMSFNNPYRMKWYLHTLQSSLDGLSSPESHIPLPPTEIDELLQRGGYDRTQPLVSINNTTEALPTLNIVESTGARLATPWLPIAPAAQFGLLNPDRQFVYLERFLEHQRTPVGWMIVMKEIPTRPQNLMGHNQDLMPDPYVLQSLLERYYKKQLMAESQNFFLLRFSLINS